MKKYKVTQVRSTIKRPAAQKRTMEALGLRKINQSVEHQGTPQIEGMINAVRHLVIVEEI
jgi:large subunit ribosomal protein L30